MIPRTQGICSSRKAKQCMGSNRNLHLGLRLPSKGVEEAFLLQLKGILTSRFVSFTLFLQLISTWKWKMKQISRKQQFNLNDFVVKQYAIVCNGKCSGKKIRDIGPSICLVTFKQINYTRDDYNTSIKIHISNKIQKKNHDINAKEPMSNLLFSTRECVSITNMKIILCISI